MNHSSKPTATVCRILHLSPAAEKSENPIVLRRTCDISAMCGRLDDGEDNGAVLMHVHTSKTTPLLRCIAIGAAVIGAAAVIAGICRAKRDLMIRRKYARRYADRYRRKLHRRTETAADAAPKT